MSTTNRSPSFAGQPAVAQGRASHKEKPNNDSDDDEYGPAPPEDPEYPKANLSYHDTVSTTIPTIDNLRARYEDEHEARELVREQATIVRRLERKIERKALDERLDDLAPRAVAGTRERQIEKRREIATSNLAFAQAKTDTEVELKDSDVMGVDTVAELKRMQAQEQRKKNEREIRKEEMLKARRAEREERQKGLKEKEAKTMQMLKELANERYG